MAEIQRDVVVNGVHGWTDYNGAFHPYPDPGSQGPGFGTTTPPATGTYTTFVGSDGVTYVRDETGTLRAASIAATADPFGTGFGMSRSDYFQMLANQGTLHFGPNPHPGGGPFPATNPLVSDGHGGVMPPGAGGVPPWAGGITPGSLPGAGGGGLPGGGGGTPGAGGGTAEQQNALAYLTSTLDQWGLGSLASWAWNQITLGLGNDYIIQQLRQTSEYKTRFAGMALRSTAGLAPISESEYIATERSYAQVLRAQGLPAGLYDTPDDFAQLIGFDVSPQEFNTRITDKYARVANQAPEIRSAFDSYFGVGGGDAALAAVFMDPSRGLPELEKMVAASEIGGTGSRFGFGVDRTLAMQLAGQGVTEQGAETGFGNLYGARGLLDATASEQGNIGVDAGIEAFVGGDAASLDRFRRRAATRQAGFEGGGGVGVGAEGAALGAAPQGR